MSLLEVLGAERDASGLTVRALVEVASPEDDHVFAEECHAFLPEVVFDDLPSSDDLPKIATYIESLYLDWQSL